MGNVFLRLAIRSSSVETVKLFLGCCVDVSAVDSDGLTPLHEAFRTGNREIIDLVSSVDRSCYKNVNPIDDRGLSHFHAACMRNDPDVVRTFLQNGVDVNSQVNPDVPEWIFRLYDPESINGIYSCSKETANSQIPSSSPSWACKYTPLHFAVENKCPDVVELLVKHGADVNAFNISKQTPLHLACMHFSKRITRTLIKGGANISVRCKKGETSLHLAVIYRNKDAVYLMLKYAPVLEVQKVIFPMLLDHWAWGDLHNEDIYIMILKHMKKADPRFIWKLLLYKSVKGDGPDRLRILFDYCDSKHINDVDESTSHRTLLQAAVCHLSVLVVELLLRKGADPTLRNPDGGTVLHKMAACLPKKLDIFEDFCATVSHKHSKYEACHEIINLLLKYGCDLGAKDSKGNTPLHIAVLFDEENIARALLQHGADVNVENGFGRVPLSYCGPTSSADTRIAYEKHILKLRVIGFPVHKQNEEIFHKAEQSEEQSLKFIKRCKREIDEMKKFRITECSPNGQENLSVYDFVHENTESTLLSFVNDESFMKLVERNIFKKTFPLYGYLVHIQVEKGFARKVYLNARQFFVELGVPELCIDIILKYLTRDDYDALDRALSM